MPTAGWWEALWPDPAAVLTAVGIKPGMEVIDLCSGDGWFTLQIAKIARHVIAIDIDLNMLEVARDRLNESSVPNCDFVAGDAYELAKLVAGPANFVFMANAFHGVPDRARLARAVRAALKPGGHFAIVNWHQPPRPVRSRPAPMCSDPVAANSSTARAPSIGPQRNLRKRNRRLAPVEQRRFLRKRNGRRRGSCCLSIRPRAARLPCTKG